MADKYFPKTKVLSITLFVLIAAIFLGAFFFFERNLSVIIPSKNIEVFLEKKDICTILITDDEIFAGGATGLFVLKPENVGENGEIDYMVSEIGKLRYVRDLVIYKEQVLIAYDEGILTYKDDNLDKFEADKFLPDKRVNSLFVDSEGMLWAGTWGGALVYDGNLAKHVYTQMDGIAATMVNKIFEDSYKNIWLGSYVAPAGGVSIIYHNSNSNNNNENISVFTVKKGLLHSNINDIIQVDESVVMVGGGLYNKGGITTFSYDDRKWNISGYIQKSDGLAGEKVRSMMLDSKSNLWLGSEYDGLAVFDFTNGLQSKKIATTKDGLSHDEIKVMKEDIDGNIWIGTMKGLIKLTKGEF